MKIKNIVLVLFLFAITTIGYSQVKVYKHYTESAPMFSAKFSDVDSLSTLGTDWFDATAILGQTLYLADSVYSADTGTFRFIIQGRYKVSYVSGGSVSSIYFVKNLDTVSSSANGVVINTLSLSAFAPECRIIMKPNSTVRNNSVVWWLMFANTTNYLREQKSYGNIDP